MDEILTFGQIMTAVLLFLSASSESMESILLMIFLIIGLQIVKYLRQILVLLQQIRTTQLIKFTKKEN